MIEVINRQRLQNIDRNSVAQLSRAVLDRIGREDWTLTIIFIRDRMMRELNRDYRGIDQPTDVLSFAYHESMNFSEPEAEANHLGDVVISVETAEAYARELGLTYDREIAHLVIHGALHLAGYDHETDNGEMMKLERKLRKELLRMSKTRQRIRNRRK
ncbi:MAG: rRNA maturation RNase YbeY [Acidobacteria bacterium]|nr:rRNA maturation RNase YbeY [Acidobacteriota bacterium]MCI0664909.1 rRNA maturation RNase YbeY [Acidobacteriota bacterium]